MTLDRGGIETILNIAKPENEISVLILYLKENKIQVLPPRHRKGHWLYVELKPY